MGNLLTRILFSIASCILDFTSIALVKRKLQQYLQPQTAIMLGFIAARPSAPSPPSIAPIHDGHSIVEIALMSGADTYRKTQLEALSRIAPTTTSKSKTVLPGQKRSVSTVDKQSEAAVLKASRLIFRLLREKKQKGNRRAARGQPFSIWEDNSAVLPTDMELIWGWCYKPESIVSGSLNTSDSSYVEGINGPHRTLLDYTAFMTGVCEFPWMEGKPNSGDSWNRLMLNANFLDNNQIILCCLRTLYVLRSHYPYALIGGASVGRSPTNQDELDDKIRIFYEDKAKIASTLNITSEWHDILQHPIWRAWLTAPGEHGRNAARDPDMDQVLDAIEKQHKTFIRVRRELRLYVDALEWDRDCSENEPPVNGGWRAELKVRLELPWERKAVELDSVRFLERLAKFNPEYTRTMR